MTYRVGELMLRAGTVLLLFLVGCSASVETVDGTGAPQTQPDVELPTTSAADRQEAGEPVVDDAQDAEVAAQEVDRDDVSDKPETTGDDQQQATRSADWADSLAPGVCFNEVEEADGFVPGALVDCGEPHDHEVFYASDFADASDVEWPGFEALTDQAFDSFCDRELVEFAGRSWDLLPFASVAWVPDEQEWSDGSRSAVCSVASATVGAPMIGTAAGTPISPSSTDFIISLVDGDHGGLELAIAGPDADHASLTIQDGGLYKDALAFDGSRTVWFVADPDGDGSRALMGLSLSSGDVIKANAFDGRDVWNPTAAPDGTVIVSAGFDPNDTELWSVTRTGDPKQLTDTPGLRVDYPAVGADGALVVFSATTGDGGANLWSLDVVTEQLEQLTDGSDNDIEPAVAPDGSQIVFTSDRSGNLDVWAVAPDGSDPTNLTNHPSDDSQATYSTTTDRVIFQSNRYGLSNNTMFMFRDGSDQNSVTFDGVHSPEVLAEGLGQLIYATAFNNQMRFCDVPGAEGIVECSPWPGQELVSVTTNPEPFGVPWPGQATFNERIVRDCKTALDARFGTDRDPREVLPLEISEEMWDFGARISGCSLVLSE